MRELGTEIERSLRYGRRFVLALCDLDDFKSINDTDGHPAGDRALEAVAALLEGTVRASDFAFRIGGDEFALLLPETDADEAQEAVGRIVAALAGDSVLAARPGHQLRPRAVPDPRQDARGAHPPRRPGALRGQALRRRPALRAARRLSGHTLGGVADPGHVAVGTWSGGRFMHFGEPLDDERLLALLRPGERHRHRPHRRRLRRGRGRRAARPRAATGVDARRATASSARSATTSTRASARARRASRASPTRALRGPGRVRAPTCAWRPSARWSASAPTRFDLLLLHNPDRTGYTSPAVWEGMAALRDAGPDAAARRRARARPTASRSTSSTASSASATLIDWAMVILNPLEPWPGELVLPAARAPRRRSSSRASSTTAGSSTDDVRPGHAFAAARPPRASAPTGWVEAGRERLERMRPIAERHGLTTLQLACQWNLAHDPVALRRPDADPGARRRRAAGRGQARRARRRARASSCSPTTRSPRSARSATTPAAWRSRAPSPRATRASPQPDRWPLTSELRELAARWAIEPERELSHVT